MTINHEILGTCTQTLARHYLCSTQIEVNSLGLTLRKVASISAAKNGSAPSKNDSHTSDGHRDRARSERSAVEPGEAQSCSP